MSAKRTSERSSGNFETSRRNGDCRAGPVDVRAAVTSRPREGFDSTRAAARYAARIGPFFSGGVAEPLLSTTRAGPTSTRSRATPPSSLA
jgi:hypothetical protein